MTSQILLSLTLLLFSSTSFAAYTLTPEAYSFDTNVTKLNMTKTQISKIRSAEEHIKDVVATEEFKSRVLKHTYQGKRTFVDNGGLTNTQIYYKILEGAETLQPSKNNRLDVEVKLYYENSNTVGYTTTSSKRINMNTKYFNKYSSINVSRNLMHEWLHKLGFKHAVNFTPSRDYSVPYAIGKIIEELAAKY